MIAALFVERGGCYYGLPDVEPYGGRDLGCGNVEIDRDAMAYVGPHPVVAHPPCKRWGAFSEGSPLTLGQFTTGDDGGTFRAALAAVRKWGGVIEHPANSKAWAHFGMIRPPACGGWVRGMFDGGWTCHVEQGHYGHFARKPTWLYYVGAIPPEPLIWGPSEGKTPEELGYSPGARGGKGGTLAASPMAWVPKRERLLTPEPFRDMLIALATSCGGAS